MIKEQQYFVPRTTFFTWQQTRQLTSFKLPTKFSLADVNDGSRRFWVDGRQVRSNFGTTKYCATYLRNSPCQNPDCLYLHELGDEEDRFTKEEIQQRSLLAPPIPPGAVTVTGGGGPSGTGKRCTSPFLPPPVYESSDSGPGGAPQRMMGQPAAAAQRAGGRGAKPSAQLRNSALLQQMQQQRRPHEAQVGGSYDASDGSIHGMPVYTSHYICAHQSVSHRRQVTHYFVIRFPSAVLAFFFMARRVQRCVPLDGREVE